VISARPDASSSARKIHRRFAVGVLAAASLLLGAPAAPAAVPAPAWSISVQGAPTNFLPSDSRGLNSYYVRVSNVGAAPTDGSPITLTNVLPAGMTLNPVPAGVGYGFSLREDNEAEPADSVCDAGPPATCTVPQLELRPGHSLAMLIPVNTSSALGAFTNFATVKGGGAPSASASFVTEVSATPAPFDIQSSSFSLKDEAGQPVSQAGSHPYSFTTAFQVNTKENSLAPGLIVPVESIKDIRVTLPRGLVVNPSATPVRCTEVQLDNGKCPSASVVGLVHPTVAPGGAPTELIEAPIYNMVPPPGMPALLGMPILDNYTHVHLRGGVNSAGEYELSAAGDDIIQYGSAIGATVELWGSPSDPSHDYARSCTGGSIGAFCPAQPTDIPFLTMPGSCPDMGTLDYSISSWENRDTFVSASAEATDADGDPVGVSDCAALDFKPTLRARPTTNVADSPSGLEVDLHIPQTDNFSQRATANLKKAVVTLPEGLVVNPSGANGLDACSSARIGLTTPIGQSPIRFTGASPSCPEAAKIGTVEVNTPLLGNPLPGSVYIATPHDNPFGSFLAIYLVVDDPATGIVVKLAGRVTPNPDTGRLTTTFDDNPQLPFSNFKLDFKAGPHGVLRTPAACGDYSTTSELTPWSGNPAETPHDDYSIDEGPSGSCASSVAAQPHAPSFDGGSVSPIAGAHSPFVVHLRRDDGTQQFSAVTVKPPPGLAAKLAGTTICPDSAIAAAAAKSGSAEKASQSCPASSEVGSVTAGAGAGPAPYYAPGKVYMSGPYKGAPLSFAIVTPATAGPFDLGTVVVRTAIHVDPKTAAITAVSDPLPRILQGIELDVRTVDLALDRPEFTLNGTSCEPSSVSGLLTSTQGQVASLFSRFQLGDCAALGFKPKMTLRLKGGTKRGKYPQLTVVLEPRPGDANIASLSLAMPRSEFLANEHIRTICTRVDFAADTCPSAAVYGEATVQTPVLDHPLTGNVYLRASDNRLPDLVPDLRGPASQPIKIESAGRTDSFKRGLRNTFDFIPDAPFTRLVTRLQGGSKGLLINSRNLCKRTYRATVHYSAHNGDTYTDHPVLRVKCGNKARKGKRHGNRRAGR